MFSSGEPWARSSVFYINAELSHAEQELSCVEFSLRSLLQRFSQEEIARYARRDIVRKSLEKANSLANFYWALSMAKRNQGFTLDLAQPPLSLRDEQIEAAISCFSEYLQKQRDQYFPVGAPLSHHYMSTMEHFFSPVLVRKVRTVEVEGQQIQVPPFYSSAKALGIRSLPQLSHTAPLTFIDVLAFTGPMTERKLLHALVHAAQFEVLGRVRYAELYVHAFLRFSQTFLVPLEAHAFSLCARFSASPSAAFDVEAEIREWSKQGRYATDSPMAVSAQ